MRRLHAMSALAVLALGMTAARASHPAPTYTVARVHAGDSVALRKGPGGPAVARVGARTPFGSPTHLAVAARHGRWVGVVTSAMPNGRLAWIDGRSRSVRRARTAYALRVDLSRRDLTLLHGRRAVRRIRVGAGSSSSPTPIGRFAVTDKLSGPRFSPAYGCCVLALSGHQPHTPAGWQGGNRLAIHGTDTPASVGARSSAGCLHARDRDLRVLMRRVPLGTPVFIRR